MDAEQLLKKAWEAVKKSGVPASIQPIAFTKAIEIIEADKETGGSEDGHSGDSSSRTRSGARRTAGGGGNFYSKLGEEADVSVADLKEILHIAGDGEITVLPVTRKLGATKSEQIKTLSILVIGARHGGLGESQPLVQFARDACKQKNCWDEANFSKYAKSVPGLNIKGTGPAAEFVLTPKWTGEFKAVVARVLGKPTD